MDFSESFGSVSDTERSSRKPRRASRKIAPAPQSEPVATLKLSNDRLYKGRRRKLIEFTLELAGGDLSLGEHALYAHPVPARDLAEVERLIDNFAGRTAVWHLESIYGHSESFTNLKLEEMEMARTALLDYLRPFAGGVR